MRKCSFILVKNDNDGRSLLGEIVELQADLTHLLGGWTRSRALGSWRNGAGVTFRDESYAYFVLLEDGERGDRDLETLKRCLREFKAKTLQEAIYLDVAAGVTVDFV